MGRPSENQVLMDTARMWSKRGTCSRLRVGAVLSRDGRIIATGYNGAVSGALHCVHFDNNPCDQAVHAEENVLYFAARHGVSTEGSTLFVTHAPCAKCARGLVNAGVSQVIYATEYRSRSGIELLNGLGIPVFKLDGGELFDSRDWNPVEWVDAREITE